ncbi:MAG: putative ATP-grasp-modified RiPP [Pseudonocardia sp.]
MTISSTNSAIPTTPPGFADDPLASHSGQFGLARPIGVPLGTDEPSPDGARPWNLRAAQPPQNQRMPLTGWRYDHDRQIAVAADGRPLTDVLAADATANSVSDLDGDEGRSEDWSYDFCPDQPGTPW